MATIILPIEKYTFNSGCLVPRKSYFKALLKLILVIMLLVHLGVPNELGDSYLEHTPIAKTEKETKSELENYIKVVNSDVNDQEVKTMVTSAFKWAAKYRIDPLLILSVIHTESTFAKHAISSAGAFGLMQVLPKWHLDKIKDARDVTGTPELFDIDTNIYLGTRILKECQNKYQTIEKSLLCYNGSVGTNSDYAIKVLKNKRKLEYYI